MLLYIILGIIIVGLIITLCIVSSKKAKEIQDSFKLELEVEKLQYQKIDLEKDIKIQQDIVNEYNDKIIKIKEKYHQELNKKTDDLNVYFENQKQLRQ